MTEDDKQKDAISDPTIVSAVEAIDAFRNGEMLIMVDDESRENEGDFISAAEHATPEVVNFMATHGRGLICASITGERAEALELEMMAPSNTARHGTAFTVSVDALDNATTGISAADRAETIRCLVDPATKPEDLGRPGHIFPLVAMPGGVLRRAGHTEGVVDLCRLAGLQPAGVLCEILNEDGSMARMPELVKLAYRHKMKIVTIQSLIAHRTRSEHLVSTDVSVRMPNAYGTWNLKLYEYTITGETHEALVMGDPTSVEAPLVRVHSQCFTGDTLGSQRCDCAPQLHAAMRMIGEEGVGVLVYMHQEGRGIGLKNKLKAYDLQDHGRDTVEANEELGFKADLRDYGIGAQILADLGLERIRLMTNNPRKIIGLEGYGLSVVERVHIEVGLDDGNMAYLRTKRDKMGHLLKNVQ